MKLLNPFLIVGTAVLAVILAIAAGAYVSGGPTPEQSNKLTVAKILLEERKGAVTANYLIAGCMARVMSNQQLVAQLLNEPNLCNQAIQAVGTRIVDGRPGTCALGDAYCAFAAGYVRVVAGTGTQPRTPDEFNQMLSDIDSEFEKLKQREQK